MRETNIYVYQGENGKIRTALKLDLTPIEEKVRLTADSGKILTDGTRRVRMIEVPASEKANWTEEVRQEGETLVRPGVGQTASIDYKKMLDIVTGADEN